MEQRQKQLLIIGGAGAGLLLLVVLLNRKSDSTPTLMAYAGPGVPGSGGYVGGIEPATPPAAACPPGTILDANSGQCISFGGSPGITGGPTCTAGSHWDANAQRCVADAPAPSGGCPAGQHWEQIGPAGGEGMGRCVPDSVFIGPPLVDPGSGADPCACNSPTRFILPCPTRVCPDETPAAESSDPRAGYLPSELAPGLDVTGGRIDGPLPWGMR